MYVFMYVCFLKFHKEAILKQIVAEHIKESEELALNPKDFLINLNIKDQAYFTSSAYNALFQKCIKIYTTGPHK